MNVALQMGNVSPEGLAFVRGISPSSVAASPEPENSIENSKAPTVAADSQPAPRTTKGSSAALPSRHPVLVGLSTRIGADLHESLMRASFERKLARQEPWSHQDILSEALTAWLKKAGYR